MFPRVLLPIAFLWLLALREREQGAAFVIGTGAAWTALCVVSSALVSALRARGTALTIGVLVANAWLFGLLLSTLEPRFWPAADAIGPSELLQESVLSMHLALLCWSFMAYVPYLRADVRAREAEAKQAAREAELASLRERLTPHFLRNTLHTVSALSLDDPDRARSLLAALADLLEDPGPGDVEPLGRQVTWLRSYVSILEARFEGRLRFEFVIEPGVEAQVVPRLLLQPLVENAVEHGALRRDGPARVGIEIRRDGRDHLVFTVEDDGPGWAGGEESLGLYSVRRRLALAHADARLSITPLVPGTRARVSLPLRSVR